jgi:hypothetical protein
MTTLAESRREFLSTVQICNGKPDNNELLFDGYRSVLTITE